MIVCSHGTRGGVPAPGEGGIDDAAFGHQSRAVPLVEGQIVGLVPQRVTEHLRSPPELTDMRLRVRVEQQLVMVEAVAVLGIVRAVHAVSVDSAGASVGQVAVPDLIRVFGQFDAFQLAFASCVEKAELDFRRKGGEQRKIHAESVPRRPKRVRQTFGHTRLWD